VLTWIIAALAASALVVFLYRRERLATSVLIASGLRFVAALFAVALAFNAPRGRTADRQPLVVIDASASWLRGRDSSAWRDALARARDAARGDTLWAAGDSLRPATPDLRPGDATSRVESAVTRALGAGRPLVLFTDGELDDPQFLDRLLARSRLDVAAPGTGRDAAMLALDLPRSMVGGDTAEIIVRVAAGPAGAGAGMATVMLERTPVARIAVDSLAAGTERDLRARVRIPVEGGEHRVVRAALQIPGDNVAQNDTLGAALDVAAVPSGVFVSTAPDQDSRFALDVLRGTLSIAVRAFYRVAPGVWRQEPAFTSVTEAAVREALADAPLAIIHGDTALFGPPRAFTTGALALIAPAAAPATPNAAQEEWYVTAAPTSPLSAALAGLPWDSLAPISLTTEPHGEWTGLTARRPRTTRDDRVAIAGSERPRRVVVVAGSGYWRWRFRGGPSADAFAAMWGGVFDWLAAGGDDRRAAVPAGAWTRAGEPVSWRRGARRDSSVVVVLRRLDGAGVDTVTLAFPGDATIAESPPLPMGEYEVTVPGGRTRLVVVPSREWLPRRAAVASGEIGTGRASGLAPRLRDAWWAYVVIVAALCVEWVLRRRAGLR
jgi:hypothetical protein